MQVYFLTCSTDRYNEAQSLTRFGMCVCYTVINEISMFMLFTRVCVCVAISCVYATWCSGASHALYGPQTNK